MSNESYLWVEDAEHLDRGDIDVDDLMSIRSRVQQPPPHVFA